MKQGNKALYVAVHVYVEGWQFRPQDPEKYIVKMRFGGQSTQKSMTSCTMGGYPSYQVFWQHCRGGGGDCNGEDAWWDCNGAAGAELYYGSQFITRANGCGTCNWWG